MAEVRKAQFDLGFSALMLYGAKSLNCHIEKGLIFLFIKENFHSLGKISLILFMQNIFSVHSVFHKIYFKAVLRFRIRMVLVYWIRIRNQLFKCGFQMRIPHADPDKDT